MSSRAPTNPPPLTAAAEYDALCESYISEIYQGVSGFISYEPGEKEKAQEFKVFLTYGEILFPSFNKVIERMILTEDDIFYDLGSGVGKSALQFFLKTPVKKVVAIEANDKRIMPCFKVYDQVKEEFPALFEDGRRSLTALQANFLDVDMSDATIIYTCSTCFNTDMLADIGKIVDACPNIKYLVSIPSVTYDYASIPNKLPIEEVVDIECSWGTTKFYFYSHNPAQVVDPAILPSLFVKKDKD